MEFNKWLRRYQVRNRLREFTLEVKDHCASSMRRRHRQMSAALHSAARVVSVLTTVTTSTSSKVDSAVDWNVNCIFLAILYIMTHDRNVAVFRWEIQQQTGHHYIVMCSRYAKVC